jgi:hypothetical protein
MPHEAYCIAYRENRWSVLHGGRDLGAFYLRTNALKFAVRVAHSSAATHSPNVYILDRSGDFYTVWNGGKDVISLDA